MLRIGVVVGLVMAFGASQSAALERSTSVSRPPAYSNGPWAPIVHYVGDSISAHAHQKDIYAWINAGRGWHTRVDAKGGANITNHIDWGTFITARNIPQSLSKAVVVELGTNSISGIRADTPAHLALPEWQRIFTAIDGALARLGSQKCVVWVGLNQVFDAKHPALGVITWKEAARVFNNYLKQKAKQRKNVHYANYSQLINTNGIYLWSIATDSAQVHPTTLAGKRELGIWTANQVQRFC